MAAIMVVVNVSPSETNVSVSSAIDALVAVGMRVVVKVSDEKVTVSTLGSGLLVVSMIPEVAVAADVVAGMLLSPKDVGPSSIEAVISCPLTSNPSSSSIIQMVPEIEGVLSPPCGVILNV